MKKNLTRVFMLVSAIVISLSLILGLAGCSPSGNEGFAKAEENWKTAQSKSAVDKISLEIDLSQTISGLGLNNVKIFIDITISRTYGAGGQLLRLEGSLDKVEVTGAEGILSVAGGFIPDDVNIGALIQNGRFVLNDAATGVIEYDADEGEYIITGGLVIPALDVNLTSEDGPVYVDEKDVINGMADLGVSIPFDMLSLYDLSAGTIGKDNTASIDGDAALNWIKAQILNLASIYFSGEMKVNDDDIPVDDMAVDIVTVLAGGTTKAHLEAYMDELFSVGPVSTEITYKGKNFDTIKTANTIAISFARADINAVLGKIDLGENANIVDSVMNLVRSQATINITLKVETKVTIG